MRTWLAQICCILIRNILFLGELFVIVEFCRYGNLQNYIYKHRENFIDQIDPATGIVDYNIGQEISDRSYSVGSDSG